MDLERCPLAWFENQTAGLANVVIGREKILLGRGLWAEQQTGVPPGPTRMRQATQAAENRDPLMVGCFCAQRYHASCPCPLFVSITYHKM